MNRSMVLLLAAAVVAVSAWSQDVNEAELRSVGQPDIVFESYTGPHTAFDTAEEIVGIGRALALSLRTDGRRGEFFGLYSVIRAIDPAERQKLDADIIVFEKNGGVDHINNVRRIVSGYVQTAFGYSRADADLLAVFTTYYNAVYRGKLDELGGKYSAAVMANISAENAGIALSYRDWPGKTRLLLPFSRDAVLPAGSTQGGGQPAGAMSTTELTQQKVVEQLRSEPDKGLEERKAMVDLKEREVDQAKQTIAADEKMVTEKKAEIAKQEEAAKAAPAPGASPAAGTAGSPATTGSTGTPTPKQQAIAEEKAKVVEAEKAIEVRKEAVAAKEAEIARDRQGIVADEKTTPAAGATQEAAKAAVSESVLYLEARGSAQGARLSVIDPVTRELSVSAGVGGISVPDFSYFKDRVVLIARVGQLSRLLLVDAKTLEVAARGEDLMYAGSYLHSQAGAVYAVSMDGATARLAKYDEGLSRLARSAEPVDRDTYIRIFGDELYVSAPDGSILVLSAADLTLLGKVGSR